MLYPGRIIKAGEQDAELVKALKVRLNEALGIGGDAAPRLDPNDHIFGPKMKGAVKLFQARWMRRDGRLSRTER